MARHVLCTACWVKKHPDAPPAWELGRALRWCCECRTATSAGIAAQIGDVSCTAVHDLRARAMSLRDGVSPDARWVARPDPKTGTLFALVT